MANSLYPWSSLSIFAKKKNASPSSAIDRDFGLNLGSMTKKVNSGQIFTFVYFYCSLRNSRTDFFAFFLIVFNKAGQQNKQPHRLLNNIFRRWCASIWASKSLSLLRIFLATFTPGYNVGFSKCFLIPCSSNIPPFTNLKLLFKKLSHTSSLEIEILPLMPMLPNSWW